MSGIVAFVPVGPADEEPARVADLLASLEYHEPGRFARVLLVDDGTAPRDLAGLGAGTEVEVLRTSVAGRGAHPYQAMTAGTLSALHRAGQLGAEAVLKLDTDALVVGPVVDRALAAVRSHPETGIFGSYDHSCDGGRRDWTPHRFPVPLSALPLPAIPGRKGGQGRPQLRPTHPRRAATRFRHLRDARRNGYRIGEHCLGGSYLAGGALAAWLADPRHFRDCTAWLDTRLGEDVTLGLVTRAAGLDMRGLVAPGDLFAIHHVGLPGEPRELVQGGAGVVHSLRNHAGASERQLRDAFARLRADDRVAVA